ncbi:MAG: hypothetical protein NTZ83_05475 [Candidatus Pacearchaeota archaeon]|nr:hypothetical protein [Candidatus Pacearchaeota archaeon]
MDNFSEFIRNRTSKVSKNNSNCIGTALYLAGETDSDKYLSRASSKRVINNMERAIKPEIGYLVLWESDGIPIHSGVILMDNPFRIVYRDKKRKLLIQDSLDKFSDYLFKHFKVKPTYRIPNKLIKEVK